MDTACQFCDQAPEQSGAAPCRNDRHSAMPDPLEERKGEEAHAAATWLAELRRRLDDLQEQMANVEDPQDFCGVRFEHWMERYMDLREQIDLLEQFLRKSGPHE